MCPKTASPRNNPGADNSFEGRVRKVVDERIRPSLFSHGGDLRIKEIKGTDVGFVFLGACRTCPSAQITLEETIDRTLRMEIPEVGRVYLINETSEDLLDLARKLIHRSEDERLNDNDRERK